MNLSNTYELSEDIAYRVIDGEAMVLNLNDGEHYSLNGTGTEILELMARKKDLKFIISTMNKEYGIDNKVIEEDLIIFVKELLTNKLISMTKGGEGTLN
ncbi:MAG: PqqD family protein [Candidatus Omnitrophota bacterium]|nr:MAG: PqqD family protein [Candidatus Omnitrophota bacterium]